MDQVRCIHEKHEGAGYRPEWAHRTAGIRGSLQNSGDAWFDRRAHLWHLGGAPGGGPVAPRPEDEQAEDPDSELPRWEDREP